jgi:hypothetical protein
MLNTEKSGFPKRWVELLEYPEEKIGATARDEFPILDTLVTKEKQ